MKELVTNWVCLEGWKITFEQITKDIVVGEFKYMIGQSYSFKGIIDENLALCFVVEVPESSINPSSLFSFQGKFIINEAITKLSLNCCISNQKTMKSRNMKLVFYKKDYIPAGIIQYK